MSIQRLIKKGTPRYAAKYSPTTAGGNIFNIAPGKIAVVQGLKDYIVVDSGDVLLIVKKEEEQSIKITWRM